jgi:hypothetical protein
MAPKRLKDVDSADLAVRLKAAVWAFAVGVAFGGFAGLKVAEMRGWNPWLTALVGFVVVSSLVYGLAIWITMRGSDVAQTIYNPSGGSTPYKEQYSYAQSLVVRGRFQDAAAAYELHAIENPAEPEPYLHLARLYRDKLQQYDDALTWFRRARTDASLGPGQELYVIQEIIDLYIHNLRTPRKAIPELTLVCQRFPSTPAARAAEKQLAEMREMLSRERDGVEPFTAQFLKHIGRGSVADAARDVLREVSAEHGADPQ